MAASIAVSDGESIVRIDDEDLNDQDGPCDEQDGASVAGTQMTDPTEVSRDCISNPNVSWKTGVDPLEMSEARVTMETIAHSFMVLKTPRRLFHVAAIRTSFSILVNCAYEVPLHSHEPF